MDQTNNLKLPYIMPSQAQKQVTHNEALAILDGVVQLAVADRTLAAPPGSPAEGDRHIVAAGATGAWAGKDGAVAAWQDGTWSFFTPLPGWLAWVAAETALFYWSGTAWTNIASAISVLQNLTLLGLGTTADATNPFSAKLNKALWTAKYAAEGGDGDLRYTMNKESTADTASLLLQTNWAGHAEFGLIGDDNFTLKVSPDGSTWSVAAAVNNSTGGVTFNGPLEMQPATGSAITIDVESNIGMFQASRYADSTAGSVFFGRKSRGSKASPTAVLGGDTLLGFRAYGHTGSAFVTATSGAAFLLETAENWSPTAFGSQIRFFTTGNTTTTNLERLKIANDGSLVIGAGTQTIFDANGILCLKNFTLATLPSAASAGQLIYCSDLGGGGGVLQSDGSKWARAGRAGQAAIATDADVTLTPLSSAENIRHTGTLTANRTITLATTNAYAGARFSVTRTGSGAFNLSLGGLKNLATSTWAEAEYDGSAWYLASYGTL
jgi:hypothetical protein